MSCKKLLAGPLFGAGLATRPLGRGSLLVSLPVALLPAAFLSPQHSGLLVLLLIFTPLTIVAAQEIRRTPSNQWP